MNSYTPYARQLRSHEDALAEHAGEIAHDDPWTIVLHDDPWAAAAKLPLYRLRRFPMLDHDMPPTEGST